MSPRQDGVYETQAEEQKMPLLPPGCLVQLFQATKGFVCGSSLNTSDASRDLPAGANPKGEIWLNGAVKVWGTSTDILLLLSWGEPGTASGNKQLSHVSFGF